MFMKNHEKYRRFLSTVSNEFQEKPFPSYKPYISHITVFLTWQDTIY